MSTNRHSKTPLTPEQQAAFLLTRGCPGGLLNNTFDRVCNFMYALTGVAIHTESHEVNQTHIVPVFPDFYKPSWAEAFDTIARQTGSTACYDASRNYWIFNPPQAPQPFAFDLAAGWRAEDRGLYVCCIPPVVPVGMDVYTLGRYSPTDDTGETILTRARDAHAMRFAHRMGNPPLEAMTRTEVDGVEAIFYETDATPRPGVRWRQWVFAKSGGVFAVVSSIDRVNEAQLWPNVRAMVASLRVMGAKEAADLTLRR